MNNKKTRNYFSIKRNIMSAFLAIAMLGGAAKAELVAEYTFEDGKVTDTSGHGNNGTLRKDATIGAPGADGSEKSLRSPDITDPYSSGVVSDSPSLSIGGDLTISLWVKPDELDSYGLVTKTYKSDTHKVEYWFAMRDDKLTFVDNTHDTITTQESFITANKWQHVAIVRDRTEGKLYFYLNGELKETKDWSTSTGDDLDTGLLIGACDPCGWGFKGNIDCVKIYNEALDGNGIKEAMSCSEPPQTTGNCEVSIDKVTQGPGGNSGDGIEVKSGDAIKWIYTITNTGDKKAEIEVIDNKEGNVTSKCDKTTLAAGEVATCTKEGTAGSVDYTNTATVNAKCCTSSGGGENDVSSKITNPSFEDGNTGG
jgi:hypothetical protein